MKNNNKFHSIGKMAKIFGVSKSGYYSWLKRPESKRSKENKKLLNIIKNIYENSKRRYGSPKIYKALLNMGIKCGKNRLIRIMRENNMRSITKKKFKITTNSKHNNPVFNNILNRQFEVEKPNKVWVSDITYIYTNEDWLYLCVIIDLFSRKVIGWSLSNSIAVEIVINAIKMACFNRNYPKDVIFHSDRGVQYTCYDFQKILNIYNFNCSMSRKGNCWDNACAESFFRSLKVEEVNHYKYSTRDEARASIFEYIEIFYNRKRIHSSLGYLTPEEYEIQKSA
jgi:transposase InsO family protein